MNASQPAFLTFHPPVTINGQRRALTARIKQLAAKNGLAIAAVTTAEAFPELAEYLERHIRAGRMSGLDWFTVERAAFSADPRNLQASAQSIVTVGIPYWSRGLRKPDDDEPRGRIARYAWGLDYHEVIKERLHRLHAAIEQEVGRKVEARFLVDTARIVDRAVAARAGLGWYGKHTCLIVPGHGSWVMIGELLLDLELAPDPPLQRDCGRCSLCLDACPTGAIVAPYVVDTPRCLSFQTIEQRGVIPLALRPLLGDWVFGCDVCQEVCPYTRAAKDAPDPAFLPRRLEHAFPPLRWLLRMTEEEFRCVYRGTAVMRARRRGLARNAAVALGNIGTEEDVPCLAATAESHDEPLVRAHAIWALSRIGGAAARTVIERQWRREPDELVRTEIAIALEGTTAAAIDSSRD
ncbi:MAG: tRNA epoxyqueuosine(34) reductase QueG [Chloroflexota bacterium]